MDTAFPDTRWSLILRARQDSAVAERAINELCAIYHEPILAYVQAWLRTSGETRLEAEDLVSEFLAGLCRRGEFQNTDPEKGKLRQFLLLKLRWFFANQCRAERTLKRGGGKVRSLDAMEGVRDSIPDDLPPPDLAFQRQWARTVVGRVLDRLQEEKPGEFEVFRDQLSARKAEDGTILAAREALGLSEAAAKATLFRLRKRYGELLREEIAQTLLPGQDLDQELRELIQLLKD